VRFGLALLGVAALMLSADQARACGWDTETVFAESTTLPCVYSVVFGRYAKHTPEYLRARIAAADAALAWSPTAVDALDMKAIAQLRLGELEPAKKTMLARAAIEPEAYATHANLGTLLTFTGEFEASLKHIDAATKLEPEAHFGREKWHRALVVYLRDLQKDPSLAHRSFVGPAPTEAELLSGTKATFKGDPRVFDALVSMIAVYGADGLSHVHYALGEQLALHGDRPMAFAAFRRAVELGHPAKKDLEALLAKMKKTYWTAEHDYGWEQDMAGRMSKDYAYWEKTQVAQGLPVWRDEGVKAVFDKQHWYSARCLAPEIIRDQRAPAGELPPPKKKEKRPHYEDKPIPLGGPEP